MAVMHAERLRTAAGRASRDALYLVIALGTSVLAFAVWVTAVSVTLSLAVFIVGLPVFLLSAMAFRWAAELDRHNAALVLGTPLRGSYRSHHRRRFLARLAATARDPQTWRDLGWLMLHSLVGFGFGVAAVSIVATVAGVALAPAWYWALPEGIEWGIWTIDSLGEALLAAPLAIPLAVVAGLLLRAMAWAHAGLAVALLGPSGRPAGEPAHDGSPAIVTRLGGRAVLSLQLGLTLLAGSVATVVWALTGQGFFWPIWVWFGLGHPFVLNAALRQVVRRVSPGPRRGVAVHAASSAVLGAAAVIVWALAGNDYFWPAWVLLGLASGLAMHALWVRLAPPARKRELEQRVDVLTRTRRGALDVQAAELRRIERDLHDGAQARLVALSMQLGRAEERLAEQPELAELVRQARGEAGAAIAELRDLARGIAPPVLADRGLAAAVEALGNRVAMPVSVVTSLDRRPPPVLETAAYFVVAEALTNVAKHAPGAEVRVTIALGADCLLVEVTDDGPGGATPDGGGLTGLRHRVEALDGSLTVVSAAGAGTTIRAEMPCE